jgi:hypothetical protein
MKYSGALLLVCALPCFCQAQNTTRGPCSPIVSGNANRLTINCEGLSREQGKQLLEIVNRIAKDQLDTRAVMKALDEIKALAAENKTSPETIAQGLQMYASGQAMSPQALARSTYQMLSSFVDSQRGAEQIGRDAKEEVRERTIVMDYRPKVEPDMNSFLNELRSRQLPVDNLSELSKNIKSLANIQQLAAGFKKLQDPRAQIESQVLEALCRSYPELITDEPSFNQKQAVNSYKMIHARNVEATLDQLRSKNIPVDSLTQISKNVGSLEDVQRLADGFKKLADSLQNP